MKLSWRAALLGMFLAAACQGPTSPTAPSVTDPPSGTSGSHSPPRASGNPARLIHEDFSVDGDAGPIAAADGWVWVATYDFDESRAILDKIEPSTGVVKASIRLPGPSNFLAAGNGSVWVPANLYRPDRSIMLRIDAASGDVVDRFPGLQGPVVISSDGAIWAVDAGTDDQFAVVRLDIDSRSVTTRVPLAATPFDMVEAARSIWVLLEDRGPGNADLIRIDAVSGSVLAEIDSRPGGIWLAGSDQGVWLSSWLSDRKGTSVLVSAADNTVTSFGTIYNFRPFAVTDEYVWFVAGPHDGSVRGTLRPEPRNGDRRRLREDRRA